MGNEKIYKRGGDQNDLIEINICKEGSITEVLFNESNDIYITLQTNVEWKKFENKKGN